MPLDATSEVVGKLCLTSSNSFARLSVITVVIGVQNAEAISGKPRVVDGDSLKFGSVSVRLHGIDAPETNQTCFAQRCLGHVVSKPQQR